MSAAYSTAMQESLRVFRMTPSEDVVPWLERHIVLPYKFAPTSSGPFKARRYQRPILECWNPANGINFCGVSAGVQIP